MGFKLKIIDLFCGAGGTTTGIENALINGERIADVVACVNHDALAIKSHAQNHPECAHFTEDITVFDEHRLPNKLSDADNIWMLWASLECTNFSKAKGGKPRDADSRTLANHLFRYITWVQPDYILIENVREFLSWGPLDENGKPISRLNGKDFMKWRYAIEDLGYVYEHKFLNSANYGAYTSRERYFGCFAKVGLPIVFPEPTHDKHARNGLLKWKPVKDKLDFTNEGNSIFARKKPLVEKTLERIYAGLIKYVANGDDSFITKWMGNDAKTGINNGKSIHDPLNTITVQGRIGVAFISKYFSGKPEGKNIPVNGPAGTIRCVDGQALVQAEFLTSYYSSGENICSVNDVLPTVSTKDRFGIYFIQKYYSGGGQLSDVDVPASTIMAVDKHRLVFIDKQYSGKDNHQSIEKPCGAILKNDKHCIVEAKKFLINPQYNNNGNSVDAPAPVIIARQDKKPLGLVTTNDGDFAAILIYADDSEAMVKIKLFMAEYGIADIKMRMLTVFELKTITGFPDDYYLAGAQDSQKKFIGNAVTPIVPQRWMECLYKRLILELEKSMAA